jgi:hypothetical protein
LISASVDYKRIRDRAAVLHAEEKSSAMWGLSPHAWSIIGYVRDIVIILGSLFGVMYFYEHPEAFDAFLYWSIGHYYRH